ncbi:MAG: nicotinate-nucleotide--dimethylbenzimidazole phosphoribosyltransferase [Candidatus Sericytochromatia bacterium]|nr:nicotinate-nucleotide--dimethylbenzimidazole phosphoribosyltransferase [Candidatus Sericytochromatia bacterium]
MHDPHFSSAEREAVYRAIRERRDVRAYRPDPVPEATLWRILEAAHQAPSVGRMQPWNFILVQDPTLRQEVYDHFRAVNARASQLHAGDRQAAYQALKLQGILDAPVNLLVTCDRGRGGEHVLGRATMREMDLYSTCLAVQNLWLAARAEGLGVGWMSLMEPAHIAALLGLPDGVVPVAYLCLGHPVELPTSPLLGRVGWRESLPLDSLVFADRWGVARPFAEAPAGAPPPPTGLPAPDLPVVLAPAPCSWHPPDDPAEGVLGADLLRRRFRRLPTPRGALGRLEALALQLAEVQRRMRPTLRAPWIVVMAGDHGVAREEGVSAYKPEATAMMVYRFLSGGGVVNALARETGAGLLVADLGVDHDFGAADALLDAKVRRGTRNFCQEAAMTPAELAQAIAAGAETVTRLPELDLLVLGEMGIGNTTAASALVAVQLGLTPTEVLGPGAGLGPRGLARKQEVLTRALALHGAAARLDPSEALRCLGGYEIAGMVGAIEAAAARGVPVLLDGFIVGAAALIAAARTPACRTALIAATRSAEPAHDRVLAALELVPMLDWGLRLGEASGAALAFGLLKAAVRVSAEVSTYEEANLEEPLAAGGQT